jgi:hypothetical protein
MKIPSRTAPIFHCLSERKTGNGEILRRNLALVPAA